MQSVAAAGKGIEGELVGQMRVVLFGFGVLVDLSRSLLERPRIRRLAFAGNAAPPGGSPPL
jgi:hypothetical protein